MDIHQKEAGRMKTAIYLELMIQWHRDILETCCNDFDRRWKKGQIDMLQNMVDEIDAIQPWWTDTPKIHTFREYKGE